MMLYKKKDELTEDTWLKESINVDGITPKRMKAVDVFAAVIEYFRGQILNALQTSHADKVGISKDQLSLALEPEAASIHCGKQLVSVKEQPCGNKAIAGLQKGDKYMVFDQGGAYFELMYNFEHAKTSFKEDTDKTTIRISVAWLDTYKESTKQKLKDVIPQTRFNNKIELLNDKMRIKHSLFRSFFDYSISNVTNELDKFFKKQELSGVHTLLAVGGFSESSVLIDAVKQKLGKKVDVIVPRDPGLAVLKGAVMFGFEPGTIESRVSRYTYGVAMQRNYIDGVDNMSMRPTFGSLIDDVFDIHVRKGQVVEIGHFQPEHTYFPVVDEQKCAHFEFFASEEVDPKYTTENGCNILGVLGVDLTRKDSKDGELSLKINASGTEIGKGHQK
ncbi:unnamed protein product [Mytilus coruscus]|uniref:Uncharacterized protein n=1 Tax=Mytilus coruscus TaxID=42192 RepID=A0A6J8DF01_MYTCO|nr:unnamed protein product [Mytilus coruscus]